MLFREINRVTETIEDFFVLCLKFILNICDSDLSNCHIHVSSYIRTNSITKNIIRVFPCQLTNPYYISTCGGLSPAIPSRSEPYQVQKWALLEKVKDNTKCICLVQNKYRIIMHQAYIIRVACQTF